MLKYVPCVGSARSSITSALKKKTRISKTSLRVSKLAKRLGLTTGVTELTSWRRLSRERMLTERLTNERRPRFAKRMSKSAS